jgi:hypothetical protein
MDIAGKLQLKPGQSVCVVNAPSEFSLPGLHVVGADEADLIIGFAVTRADLKGLSAIVAAARADRLAWVGYPKAGKLGTDLNRDRLADALATKGIQPVRQVAIDDTWSALRFRPAS